MSVNVLGGALSFESTIDDDQFKQKIQEMEKSLKGLTNTFNQQAQATEADFQGINAELQKTIQTIEQLKSMKLERQNFVLGETDIEKISKYNQEIQTLDAEIKKLESVADSQKASFESVGTTIDKSKQDLQEYLAVLDQFNKEGIRVPVNQRAPDSPRQTQQLASPLDSESLKTITQAKQVFADMDKETQLFVKELVELELQLVEVNKAQKVLDDEFDKGNISAKQYTRSTEALVAQQKNIADSLKLVTQRQKEFEKGLDGGIIGGLQSRLKNLNLQLNTAKSTAEVSVLNKEIDKTKLELAALSNAGKKGFDDMGNAIKQQEGILQRLQRQASIYKAAIDKATLPENIAKYNSKLEATNAQITRLSNVGRSGFDEFGNSIEKTASKTNVLTKSFSFLRSAAAWIPGIGLAGLFGLIAEGVSKLAANLFNTAKGLSDVKSKSDLLAESQQKIADGLAEGEAKFRPYLDALKNANLSEKDRIGIYNQIKILDPQVLAGIDAKTISYEKLANNVNNYLNTLRSQLALEANKDAVIASIKQEQSIQKQIDLLKKRKQAADDAAKSAKDSESKGLAQFSSIEAETDIKAKEKALKDQQAITEDLGKLVVSNDEKRKGSVQVIDEQIAALKKEQNALSTTRAEYVNFQNQIDKLEEERKRIVGESKTEIKAAETEFNKLLEIRKDLLQSIANLQRDAFQSGLVKEQSAVDKVREKYDLLIKKVEEFNNKAKGQRIPGISIDPITQARDTEISNVVQKQDADVFIKEVERKKEAFDQFEKYKLSVGVQNAKAIADEEIKGFDSYIDFVSKKLEALVNDNSIGAQIKKDQLSKILADTQAAKRKADADEQAKNLQEVLKLTNQFEFERDLIEQRHQKLRNALEKLSTSLTIDEYEKRKNSLEKLHQDELKALNNSVIRQSELYKKMGEDVISFSRKQLRERISELKDALANNASLTPQMRQDIQSTIDKLLKLLEQSDETVVHLNKFIEEGSKVKSALDGLGSSLDPLNKDIAQAIRQMSVLLEGTLQAANGLKNFKIAQGKGDMAGQIAAATDIFTAIIKAIGVIVEGVKKTKQAMKDVQQQTADFYTQLITGELTYQQLLRERQRQIILNNKSTLDGLEAQRKLLQQQRQENAKQASDLLTQLQSETFLSGVEAKKKGLFRRNILELFSNKPTEIKQITESLAGKTFDQLEELFNKGQLIGKAKELFEQLQKIKAEGADIDALLEENKRRAEEIFTGTTSQNIADTIAEGLRQGKRSIADFASDMEEMFRNAILSGFEARVIEEKMQEFFKSFSEAAQSNGGLDKQEIEALRRLYSSKVNEILDQFKQVESVTGINLSSSGSQANQNTLVGQFKTMSEDTGNLLAGQFGGLRLTAIDQLNLMKQSLQVYQNIDNNTALTAARIEKMYNLMNEVTLGIRKWSIK